VRALEKDRRGLNVESRSQSKEVRFEREDLLGPLSARGHFATAPAAVFRSFGRNAYSVCRTRSQA